MSLHALCARIPDYAADIRHNLRALADDPALGEQQKLGAFLAAAFAARNRAVIREIGAWTSGMLAAEAASAAKAAAALMAMNNVYFRAIHAIDADAYAKGPSGLRMNRIGAPGVERRDFELWTIAASAINGCALCIASHEKNARDAGATIVQVKAVLRIAATVHAAAVALGGEDGLAA